MNGSQGCGRYRQSGHRRLVGLVIILAGSMGTAGATMASALDVPQSAMRAEPTVDELCRAAVALSLAEPERARSFIVRARAAGWLPELRFRFFRRFARTEGLTLDDTATTTPVDVSGVDDVRYEWRATWDLSRIVFNPDEIQAHAEALRMADVRHDIQSLVIRLYFERRRLLTPTRRGTASMGTQIGTTGTTDKIGATDKTGATGKTDEAISEAVPLDPKDERHRLRVLELEAQLEALSGIAFPANGGVGATAGASP